MALFENLVCLIAKVGERENYETCEVKDHKSARELRKELAIVRCYRPTDGAIHTSRRPIA